MGKIAKETLSAKLFNDGDLLLFGTELGCLRVAYKYKDYYKSNVEYSKERGSWCVILYGYNANR